MRKDLTTNPRFAGGLLRGIAAASLACSLAVFGCSTDRMPGNGQPATMGPGVGPAPASETPGTESGNVPMASSYTRAQVMQSIQPSRPDLDALAVAAADQAYRGRTLGYASSDFGATINTATGATVAGADFPTGQFINPAMFTNPTQTINSSIVSSGPFVNSNLGVTGGAVAIGPGIDTGAAVVGSNVTTGNVTTNSGIATTGAVTSTSNGTTTTTTNTTQPVTALAVTPNGVTTMTSIPNTIATPANTALPLTVGQFAAGPGVARTTVPSTLNPGTLVITNLPTGTLTPTVSSGALLTPTQAANPIVVSTNGVTTTTTGTTTTVPVRVLSTGSVTGPLVMQRGTNGTVTISNITTTPATSFPIISAGGKK